ncbi:hypothetical protein [Dyella sp.]|uniref:hypothetical protein n=1 Tax=Dyella sp. TaxID=1869338 RepID=UPI002ED61AB9
MRSMIFPWFSAVASGALVVMFSPSALSMPQASVRDVAEHLDVLSFPNSLRPLHREHAHQFKDYGFNHFENKNHGRGAGSFEDDGTWYFEVDLIADQGPRKLICVRDEAVNGGTYHSSAPYEVMLGKDGLYHVTPRQLEPIADCPESPVP